MNRLRLGVVLALLGLLLPLAGPASAATYSGTLTVSQADLTVTVTANVTPKPNNYRIWWGDGQRRAWDQSNTATHTYAEAGTFEVVVDVAAGGVRYPGTVKQTITVGSPQPPVEDPTPVTPPAPTPSGLPYGPGSFFQSSVAGAPVDQALTDGMHAFMATNADQKAITWPKVNLNAGWSGHNHISAEGDPVWKLVGTNSGISNTRLAILKSQGVHLADATWSTVPTGTQDRLLVVRDPLNGYTMQCADVAVASQSSRTFTASNCGIMWHSSNGLDYRNPLADDQRNFTSRGRIPDAMQVPRSEIDAAIAEGRGLGHVMHIFWVATSSAAGHSNPMVGHESQTGWGGEGWRLRIKPSVDLEARGLSGAMLVLARTLQDNGGYIGDNSGSSTQLKVGPPEEYVGTNLTTDGFKGKLSWSDFEVVQPGWQ